MKRLVLILIIFILTFSVLISFSTALSDKLSVVMIIAQNNFRDEELTIPKDFLESKEVAVIIACSSKDPANGMFGKKVTPDKTIDEIDMKDFDALILVGGLGASQYFSDKRVHNLALQAYNSKKIVAAICLAPVTLANAGILKGKKATSFNSVRRFITKSGAKYIEEPVVIDGKTITADGPEASLEFAQAIYSALPHE